MSTSKFSGKEAFPGSWPVCGGEVQGGCCELAAPGVPLRWESPWGPCDEEDTGVLQVLSLATGFPSVYHTEKNPFHCVEITHKEP